MKKLISTLAVCTALTTGWSQLTVKQEEPNREIASWPLGGLYQYITDSDTTYTIMFKNQQYVYINDYKHITIGNKTDVLNFVNQVQTLKKGDMLSDPKRGYTVTGAALKQIYITTNAGPFFYMGNNQIEKIKAAVLK